MAFFISKIHSRFRGKNIIPVIVFLDIPLVSSGGYKKLINKDLIDLEDDSQYKGISTFKYNLLNVEELEEYAYASKITPIENIFEAIYSDQSKGFISEIHKILGDKKTNKNLIDRTFDKYFESFH